MSRWRPPAPRASPYITPAGFATLERESRELWERRALVTQALAAAAAEGDRSENAEYIYRKKELRELDRRIRYLQKRLPALQVVDRLPPRQDRIYFGASVTLENSTGEEWSLRIVGADEIDPERNWISVDAPMAKALLGKALDESVTVETPSGPATHTIIDIAY